MKLTLLMPLAFLSLLFTQVMAQEAESADAIMKNAYTQAKKENKKVFVMFHASWCGWCHKMDNNMNDESCKAFFDRNYVVAHLVVKEPEEKKHLENAGALEILKKYNGEKSGIPFWLVFDKEGKLLEDSFNADGQNIGCPAQPEEVKEFVNILKNTSDLNEEELAIIHDKFVMKG